MIVDRDAAVDGKPRRARELGVGADADRDHHGVGGNRGAVGELDRLGAAVAEDARGLGFEAHGDAARFDRALEQRARTRIELALHQPVHEMEHGHARARLGEAIGGLEAEQPAADDDDARTGGAGRRDGVDVVDVAEGEHARQIHAGNGGLDRTASTRRLRGCWRRARRART